MSDKLSCAREYLNAFYGLEILNAHADVLKREPGKEPEGSSREFSQADFGTWAGWTADDLEKAVNSCAVAAGDTELDKMMSDMTKILRDLQSGIILAQADMGELGGGKEMTPQAWDMMATAIFRLRDRMRGMHLRKPGDPGIYIVPEK